MKLSVIIVSYNVKYYLQQCIESVRRAINGIDAEICVIDNHSRDSGLTVVGEHKLHISHCICCLPDNLRVHSERLRGRDHVLRVLG